MRSAIAASCLLAVLIAEPAAAADCPGNPGALGTSRTIAVDPTEHSLLGGHQYRESLPLNDREVVITFDDGPLQPYTNRILDILAAECVKATFFMVGRMARGYPHLVKRVYAEGHTIANHSQNHPFTFHKMTIDQATHEIEEGFNSTRQILGDPKAVANFFRFPGLLRQDGVEQYLRSNGIMAWSVDFMADDWTHISDKEVVHRAISRIEARGKGILLLHDIQPATALGLPELLRELKVRGFKIVHVVQAGPGRPKTATLPEQWALNRPEPKSIWPAVMTANLVLPEPVLDAPNPKNFGIVDAPDAATLISLKPSAEKRRPVDAAEVPVPALALWPRQVRLVARTSGEMLPVASAENFRYARVWRQVVRPVHKPAPKKVVATTTARAPTARDGNQPQPALRQHPQRPTGHQIQIPRPTAGLIN